MKFFLTELNFLKGDTNIYFKQITFFEKKRFCKNHTHFFLKNNFFFQFSFAAFERPYTPLRNGCLSTVPEKNVFMKVIKMKNY